MFAQKRKVFAEIHNYFYFIKGKDLTQKYKLSIRMTFFAHGGILKRNLCGLYTVNETLRQNSHPYSIFPRYTMVVLQPYSLLNNLTNFLFDVFAGYFKFKTSN